jgi:hypothetical protein
VNDSIATTTVIAQFFLHCEQQQQPAAAQHPTVLAEAFFCFPPPFLDRSVAVGLYVVGKMKRPPSAVFFLFWRLLLVFGVFVGCFFCDQTMSRVRSFVRNENVVWFARQNTHAQVVAALY